MKNLSSTFAFLASVILLVTSAFHATGYGDISRQIEAASAGSFLQRAVPKLWLFFSWHLIAIALGTLATVIWFRTSARPIFIACSLVMFVDFFWVYSIAGLFAGTILIFAAGLALFAAGWLARPRPLHSPAASP